MSEQVGSYRVVDLTRGRRVWLNTLDMSWPAHPIYGLLEVDVTVPRRVIAKQKKRTGETLSFTGYLTFCLAQAVEEDTTVQSYLKGRKQLVEFDDVDVGLMVERKVGEKDTLMGHVIRGANRKTYREIHEEIRLVQSTPVPSGRGMPSWYRSAMLLPWPLSWLVKSLLVRVMSRDPSIAVSMAGTISISSVGMFGGGHGGWGISPTPQPLALVVGSTSIKPAFIDGRIESREILHLTVMFDHDVVDGGPAARFTRRLVELIEIGYGLDEDQAISTIDTEPAAAPAARAPV